MNGDVNLWQFLWDDADATWTWRQLAPTGEVVAESAFSFRSFNVCVADAERAGYVRDHIPIRRVPASSSVADQPHLRRAARERRTG